MSRSIIKLKHVPHFTSEEDPQHETGQTNFNVHLEGLAKLRHIAGWAIRKEFQR